MGEYRIVFDKAKKLMSETGGPASFSVPAVITEGKHKGKSFVLYTFRKDLNLNSMSAEEIEELYISIVKNNASDDSILSVNQNGVGVLLLDNPTKSLSELLGIALKNTKLNYLDFNRITLSNTSEKELISLFSILYKKLFHTEGVFIDNLVSLSNDASYYQSIVSEWISKNKQSDVFDHIKNILQEMFKPDNMGVPVLELNTDDTTALFFAEVEAARSKYDNDDEFNKAVNSIKQNNINKIDESLLNLDNGTLISLITNNKDTSNTSGYFLLNNKGKLILTRNNKTVITAFNNTLKAVSKNQVPDFRFDLYRFLTLIGKSTYETIKESDKFNSTVSEILNIFNDLIMSTPKFLHGINMSPIVKLSEASIEIIHDSVEAEGMLETTVKQIRAPAVVVNTNNLTDKNVVEEFVQSDTNTDKDNNRSIIDELLKRAETVTQGNKIEELLNDIENAALDKEIKAELIESVFTKYYKKSRLVHIDLDKFIKYKLDVYMLKIRPEIKPSVNLLNTIFSIYTPKIKSEFSELINLILKDGNFYESEVNFIYNILGLLNISYVVSEADADSELGNIVNTNKQFIRFIKENLNADTGISMGIYPLMKSADVLTKLHLIVNGEQYEKNSKADIDKWIAKIGEKPISAGVQFDLDNFANNSIETFNVVLNSAEDPKEYIALLEILYDKVIPHMRSGSDSIFIGKLAELLHNKFDGVDLNDDVTTMLNNFYTTLGVEQKSTITDITVYADLKLRIETFNLKNDDTKLDDAELGLLFNALDALEIDHINNLFLKNIEKSNEAVTAFTANLFTLNSDPDSQLSEDSLEKIVYFVSEISHDFDKKCTIKIT